MAKRERVGKRESQKNRIRDGETERENIERDKEKGRGMRD